VKTHSGSNGTEFTFTGEQNDPNGLEYLRARYYDSATGRFLGRDPLPCGDLYVYAGNNPANLADPTGRYYIGGWSEEWNGWIEFDSTQVGLSPCDAFGHCYVWTPEAQYELSCANGICTHTTESSYVEVGEADAGLYFGAVERAPRGGHLECAEDRPAGADFDNGCYSGCALGCLAACGQFSPFQTRRCEQCTNKCIKDCTIPIYECKRYRWVYD